MSDEAAFDSASFRRALGCFPTGVALITATDETGNAVGLTCNSFSSVSLEPPLVLWSLRLESRLLPTFLKAESYAINVLAEDQQHLSARFASRDIADKFDGVPYSRGIAGLPLIDSCIARFECSAYTSREMGDHRVFIGKVERFDQPRQENALVFQRGGYKALSLSLKGSESPGLR